MQNFSGNVQDIAAGDENIGADRGEDAAVDPISARKEAVKDMKRELIMDAAVQIIARDGVMNARLEDIAEKAGFSKASIYHYFSDKEAIIIGIVIREQRALYEYLTNMVDRALPFVDSIRDFAVNMYMKLFGRETSAFGRLAPSPAMLSDFVVSMHKNMDMLKEMVMWKKKMSALFLRIIARAKADGTLTIPVDDDTVRIYIDAFYQTIITEHVLTCDMEVTHKSAGVDINEATDKLLIFFKPWIVEK